MNTLDQSVGQAPERSIGEQLQTIDDQLQDLLRKESAPQTATQKPPEGEAHSLTSSLPPLEPASQVRRAVGKPVVRLVLGSGLVVLALWALIPLLIDLRSTQAVVNAPIVTLRSPIDGTLSFRCPTACGAGAAAKTALFDVNNHLADDGRLDMLKDEQALLEARVDGLGQQLAGFSQLRENLITCARKYQEARLNTLQLERDGAQSLAKAALAVEKQREKEKDMYLRLQPSGAASEQETDAARYTAEAAQHSAAQAQKNVENLEEQIRALRDGVHVGQGDGRNDLPYSAQRLHEISFRIEEIKAALRQDQAKLARLREHIRAEEQRLSRRTSFSATASADWVVWRQHAISGTAVKADSPLLDLIDPAEIFVDAVVSEKHLSYVRPGDLARVRIAGSDREWQAVVKQVVGRTLPWPDRLLAAEAVPAARQEAHVILSLKVPVSEGKAAIPLPVGLPAEVTFMSTWDLFKRFLGFGVCL
jgi:multidrug resistance efflux pump